MTQEGYKGPVGMPLHPPASLLHSLQEVRTCCCSSDKQHRQDLTLFSCTAGMRGGKQQQRPQLQSRDVGVRGAPSWVKEPFCASYSWVPLMMTVCAGRFTPQASVAVVHSTCKIAKSGA